MVAIDFNKCVLPPYAHQKRGTSRLFLKKRYGLFWEMRLGKTKAVIDAACFLKEQGLLDALVISCPAQVKDVWGHKELGEIKRHHFVPVKVQTFDARTEDFFDLICQASGGPDLLFAMVSHEFMRQEDAHGDWPRSRFLAQALAGKRVWTVYDEAAAFGNWKSAQTRGSVRFNELLAPDRVTALDGTPIGNSPLEQYAKFKVIDPSILGYKSWFHFRAVHQNTEKNEYATRGKKYVGFKNQERIDVRVREHCEYLEQKDCLDMPEKVMQKVPVRLGHKAWAAYCGMRDEMVAQLESGVLSAEHASVKVLRLAQICAGFAGGVENEGTGRIEVAEISDETTAWIEAWLEARYRENLGFKTVVWCRWRPEIERLWARLGRAKFFSKVGISYGGKKTYDGELHPEHPYHGPYILLAQAQSMRYGVNLSKADNELFASKDYNLVTRRQSIERIQAPKESLGGRATVLVTDVLVTGPYGERTVTFDVDEVLEKKDSIARRTAGEWKRILQG